MQPTGRSVRLSRVSFLTVTLAIVAGSLALVAQGGPNPKNVVAPLGVTVLTPVPLGHATGAIIANGTVQMGVNPEGHLNVPGGTPSSGTGTTAVGLRYIPTNAASTEPGCECEGWGVGDALSGVAGYANEAVDGVVNLTVESFVASASSAVSTVIVGQDAFRVSHAYTPSAATPNLYEVLVRIENISGAPQHVMYRRVMDWDIEPTAFDEFVTLQPGTVPGLIVTNDGFDTANPLSPPTDLGAVGAVTDFGPNDHGANFTFDFGMLDPSEVIEFRTYYGAAGTEVDALAAISAVGVEAYSFGQPNIPGDSNGNGLPDGWIDGIPNTFIFAFGGTGGGALLPPDIGEPVPNAGGDCGTVTVTVLGSRFKPGADLRLQRVGFPDIVASGVVVAPDGFSLQGLFDLTGQPLGFWDVVVSNPDDGDPDTEETDVLPDGFEIEPCNPGCVLVDIVGPSRIALNRPALFNAVIQNLGNVDIPDAMALINDLPDTIDIELVSLSLVSATPIPMPHGIGVDIPVLPPDFPVYVGFTLTSSELGELDVSGHGTPECPRPDVHHVEVVASIDPNVKIGPDGFSSAEYVTGDSPFTYLITFENDPSATAPAQEVVVTDMLPAPLLDLSTFSLGPIGFGTDVVFPPPGASDFGPVLVPFDIVADLNGDGDLLDDDILVKIEAHLVDDVTDPDHGLVTWELRSIDPSTGMLPADPLRGFLPPNTTPPDGEGHMLFTVTPLSTLATGDVVSNDAEITFDLNPPIVTPVWSNTIDKDAPSSSVSPLDPTQTSETFLVEWSGTDAGSGIAGFDVFFNVDGGAFGLLLDATTDTSSLFVGMDGHSYSFYSVATDNVGHTEGTPGTPDASTTVLGAVRRPRLAAGGAQGVYREPRAQEEQGEEGVEADRQDPRATREGEVLQGLQGTGQADEGRAEEGLHEGGPGTGREGGDHRQDHHHQGCHRLLTRMTMMMTTMPS